MSIYESIENYSKLTRMTIEKAKERCEHFLEIEKKMNEARRCPKCNQYTLALEGGEWESGISDWIYCENDKIEVLDEDGDVVFEECDFTDDVEEKYLFAYELDFDVVLYFASQIEHSGLENVEREIGLKWNDFIEKDSLSI